MKRRGAWWLASLLALALAWPAQAALFRDEIYPMEKNLKPIDSKVKVTVGRKAPDFTLPSLDGEKVSLSSFRGKKNVVVSFVPGAFTPVCSEQWPGYNLARELFEQRDAVVLGITVDSLATLNAWTKGMGGVWFPVLSDFWPHGAVAKTYGILRGNGVSERALVLVDKKGIIRYLDVHDINTRPDLSLIMRALDLANAAP